MLLNFLFYIKERNKINIATPVYRVFQNSVTDLLDHMLSTLEVKKIRNYPINFSISAKCRQLAKALHKITFFDKII